jgi:hypothetical protein
MGKLNLRATEGIDQYLGIPAGQLRFAEFLAE